ncbi:hypothetical protein H2203_005643 [Taxawa tesnikishii (nom. ined.)]|nr:hypothetical protein H2203_005643 [Dothideales sp. JES 119]
MTRTRIQVPEDAAFASANSQRPSISVVMKEPTLERNPSNAAAADAAMRAVMCYLATLDNSTTRRITSSGGNVTNVAQAAYPVKGLYAVSDLRLLSRMDIDGYAPEEQSAAVTSNFDLELQNIPVTGTMAEDQESEGDWTFPIFDDSMVEASLSMEVPFLSLDFWAPMNLDSLDWAEPLPSTYDVQNDQHSAAPPVEGMPDNRFSQVERLWPLRRPQQPSRILKHCWEEIVRMRTDNVFADAASQHSDAQLPDLDKQGMYRFDDRCRTRIEKYYGFSASVTDTPPHSGTPKVIVERGSQPHLRVPNHRVLATALTIYFRRFQAMLPIIHEPTFQAPLVPEFLLFPMCLIGLAYLDDEGLIEFVRVVFPVIV